MEYRVVHRNQSADRVLETFNSARGAVDFFAPLWHRREEIASRLYIVDTPGGVLLHPFDFRGVSADGALAR